jgi:hypothetical protein
VLELSILELTGFGVALERKHNLGCSVPSCCDVLGHVSSILFRVNTETSGQTEIADLKLAIGVDQQVTRFEITVEHVGAVNVFEAAENLVNERLEVRVGQGLSGADDGGKIALHEFFGLDVSMGSFVLVCPLILSLTLVQVCFVEVVRSGNVHVVQAGNVSVTTEVLQQLDLAQGALGQDLLGEDICDLFDSDAFASLVVGGSADDTVGALAELLGDSVALVDDEVLVEDLEDLAAGKRRVAHGEGVSCVSWFGGGGAGWKDWEGWAGVERCGGGKNKDCLYFGRW